MKKAMVWITLVNGAIDQVLVSDQEPTDRTVEFLAEQQRLRMDLAFKVVVKGKVDQKAFRYIPTKDLPEIWHLQYSKFANPTLDGRGFIDTEYLHTVQYEVHTRVVRDIF